MLSSSTSENERGGLTLAEIRQQPDLWPVTLEGVAVQNLSAWIEKRPAIICGAGTSAYAASVIAAGWPNAIAVATTDLLVCSREEILRLSPEFAAHGLIVSIGRSGDSPESSGVIARMQQMFPCVEHLAITCNRSGRLAQWTGVRAVVLDPRTNDRSLVMTSSFSNLALAGLAIANQSGLTQKLPAIVYRVQQALFKLENAARDLALPAISRVMILTPADMTPLGRETALKVLEMTAGKVMALPDTFLGSRHGPMSFLRSDSLVLCVLSSDPDKRRYEEDVIRELRQKQLGQLIIVGESIPAMAPDLPDYLRTPFEIVFPQLLAYYLSLANGLDPDNPSPGGVITRVVPQFRLHESAG